MELIKLLAAIFVFALGLQIWARAVDRADEFLREKLSSKTYDIIIWSIIIVSCIALLSLVIF